MINLVLPHEHGREIIRNDEMRIMWTKYKYWRQLPTESQRKSIHISNFNEEVK